MRTLIPRTPIVTGTVVASLAFAGTSAIAANAAVHKDAPTHAAQAHAATHVARGRTTPTRDYAHGYPRAPAGTYTASSYYPGLYGFGTARYGFAPEPYGYNVGQLIQSMLGAVPGLNARLAHSVGQKGTYVYDSSSPTYESPAIDNSSAAYDAAAQAMQMNDNNAMIQSMQAAQEQNDEANAEVTAGINAAIQTEINANN